MWEEVPKASLLPGGWGLCVCQSGKLGWSGTLWDKQVLGLVRIELED